MDICPPVENVTQTFAPPSPEHFSSYPLVLILQVDICCPLLIFGMDVPPHPHQLPDTSSIPFVFFFLTLTRIFIIQTRLVYNCIIYIITVLRPFQDYFTYLKKYYPSGVRKLESPEKNHTSFHCRNWRLR